MPNPFPNEDRKALLMTLLKIMGGVKAQVDFDGSGDSGSIDSVSLINREGSHIDLGGAVFEWEMEKQTFDRDSKEWGKATTTKQMPVEDILKQICEDALEEAGLDWYNNEGGYGSLNIDLLQDPPKVDMDVYIRITETEHHGFDFTGTRTEEK